MALLIVFFFFFFFFSPRMKFIFHSTLLEDIEGMSG